MARRNMPVTRGRLATAPGAVMRLLRWAFILALVLNVPVLGARTGLDTGRMRVAAELLNLAEAGVLCAHDPAQDDGPADKSAGHPACCDGCLSCQSDANLFGPARQAPAGTMRAFRSLAPVVPRAEAIGAAAFKRGPPPRAPPLLLEAAQTT